VLFDGFENRLNDEIAAVQAQAEDLLDLRAAEEL
jgi:hypothetical protein